MLLNPPNLLSQSTNPSRPSPTYTCRSQGSVVRKRLSSFVVVSITSTVCELIGLGYVALILYRTGRRCAGPCSVSWRRRLRCHQQSDDRFPPLPSPDIPPPLLKSLAPSSSLSDMELPPRPPSQSSSAPRIPIFKIVVLSNLYVPPVDTLQQAILLKRVILFRRVDLRQPPVPRLSSRLETYVSCWAPGAPPPQPRSTMTSFRPNLLRHDVVTPHLSRLQPPVSRVCHSQEAIVHSRLNRGHSWYVNRLALDMLC